MSEKELAFGYPEGSQRERLGDGCVRSGVGDYGRSRKVGYMYVSVCVGETNSFHLAFLFPMHQFLLQSRQSHPYHYCGHHFKKHLSMCPAQGLMLVDTEVPKWVCDEDCLL